MSARSRRSPLRRRSPKREPYPRVLIVCEGSKTEPMYLSEFIADRQLSSANIRIFGNGGSAPKSVVEYAIQLFEDEPDYEDVFCVFDRDGHTTFGAAVERVREKRLIRRDEGGRKLGAARFVAITSIPCFEYWVLLHYTYTSAAMPRFSDVLLRMRAIAELRGYEKGTRGLFKKLDPNMDVALTNAGRAIEAAKASATDNPTTRMPDLIRYLLKLADDKIR